MFVHIVIKDPFFKKSRGGDYEVFLSGGSTVGRWQLGTIIETEEMREGWLVAPFPGGFLSLSPFLLPFSF